MPPPATASLNKRESPALLPSVCRVRPRNQSIEPGMTVYVLGVPFVGLLNTGAGVPLIGEVESELCRTRKVKLRSANTLLQLASGSALNAAGTVRLTFFFNRKRRCQPSFVFFFCLVSPCPLTWPENLSQPKGSFLTPLPAVIGWMANMMLDIISGWRLASFDPPSSPLRHPACS